MPDFLNTVFTGGPVVQPVDLAARLVMAAIFGWLVTVVYRLTRSAADADPSIPPTLLLLCILIAMVTQVIGDNAARAFSLVGTLSIVRFRTVVHDTQDTAFVIFAVVTGMAVGAANLWVAGMGIPIVGLAAFVMRRGFRTPTALGQAPFELQVRVGLGQDVNATLGTALKTHTAGHRLLSMATVKQGSAIEASYEVKLEQENAAEALVKELNRIEGVQHVELKQPGTGDDD